MTIKLTQMEIKALIMAAVHFRTCGDKHDPTAYVDCKNADEGLRVALDKSGVS